MIIYLIGMMVFMVLSVIIAFVSERCTGKQRRRYWAAAFASLGLACVSMIVFFTLMIKQENHDNQVWDRECHARGGVQSSTGDLCLKPGSEISIP